MFRFFIFFSIKNCFYFQGYSSSDDSAVVGILKPSQQKLADIRHKAQRDAKSKVLIWDVETIEHVFYLFSNFHEISVQTCFFVNLYCILQRLSTKYNISFFYIPGANRKRKE